MGNIEKANTLGKVGCSFIIISTFFCVVYVIMLLLNYTNENNAGPKGYYVYVGFKWSSALFIAIAIISLILNRTTWAGGASKGDWDNAYFYSGMIILVATLIIVTAIYLISSCKELQEAEMSLGAKVLRIAIVALTLTCGWLLAVPDL